MNAMLVVVVLVVGGPQRPFESWLDASHSFELLFRGKDKEGIPYRPDLQPPPPSEWGGSEVRSIGSPWPTVCNRA